MTSTDQHAPTLTAEDLAVLAEQLRRVVAAAEAGYPGLSRGAVPSLQHAVRALERAAGTAPAGPVLPRVTIGPTPPVPYGRYSVARML